MGTKYGLHASRCLTTVKGSLEHVDYLLARPKSSGLHLTEIVERLCLLTSRRADEQRWLRAVALAGDPDLKFADSHVVTCALKNICTPDVLKM